MQEAQSKYEVDMESDGVTVEPPIGILGSDGNATIYFKRDPNLSINGTTRVSCKVS